jgi:hypothetical protein
MNYQQAGKPVCDWEDAAAREQLVDALFRDRYRALDAVRGRQLGPQVAQAAELLATVIGQDIRSPPTAASSSPRRGTGSGDQRGGSPGPPRAQVQCAWVDGSKGMWPSTPTQT